MYIFWFKHIYFTSIEKQVLTTYTNLSGFCFLGTAPVLAPNVWANEKIPKLTPAPGNRTRDLKIARPTLYLTTTDTTLKMYMTIRSRMSLVMDVIRPEHSKLSALELENFPYLTLLTP